LRFELRESATKMWVTGRSSVANLDRIRSTSNKSATVLHASNYNYLPCSIIAVDRDKMIVQLEEIASALMQQIAEEIGNCSLMNKNSKKREKRNRNGQVLVNSYRRVKSTEILCCSTRLAIG
jgi:hypothetical protein